MSDNVAITAGVGTTIACDEVVDGTLGTVKVQYVKIMDATLDGTTKAAVGAAGLKVDGSGATQPVSGTVAATQSGTWTVQPGNTANTTAWLAKIGDGTNTAAIKAASTAPAATDPALVVAVSPNGQNTNGRKTAANSAPVVEASRTYQDVAASQTATVLTGGGGGALGDWLEGILIIPETTGAGTVALLDNATSVNIFVTGTLTSLIPFYVPMGCVSASGAWKITTGSNVHVRAFGNFT